MYSTNHLEESLISDYKTVGSVVNKTSLFVLQEAVVNTLITVEVICWFFVGEIIGKRGLIGYYIPGAVDYEVHI